MSDRWGVAAAFVALCAGVGLAVWAEARASEPKAACCGTQVTIKFARPNHIQFGVSCVYRASGALPDPRCTPGALNPAVTQKTIGQTICKAGWTTTIRLPLYEGLRLKKQALALYGQTDYHSVEADHLVSLELGGAPTSLKNVWPEPHHVLVPTTAGGADEGSIVKDGVENHLNALVCKGRLSLARARRIIRTDWRTAP